MQRWAQKRTETEVKRLRRGRWQEYTEELYKKALNNLDSQDGVVTHLETDILQCEVGLRKHY